MAYGVDDQTMATEELELLARMRDWARQWGEREYYFIEREDLEYAITHNLCTVLTLNKPVRWSRETIFVFSKRDHA